MFALDAICCVAHDGWGSGTPGVDDEVIEQEENIMEKWEAHGVKYISADGDYTGGKIVNSYKITDPNEMREYATYLLYESEYQNDFLGSVDGVLFEWDVHNMIYYGDPFFSFLGFQWKDPAASVDLGATIYSDPHPGLNVIMWYLYETAYPIQAQADMKAHFGISGG